MGLTEWLIVVTKRLLLGTVQQETFSGTMLFESFKSLPDIYFCNSLAGQQLQVSGKMLADIICKLRSFHKILKLFGPSKISRYTLSNWCDMQCSHGNTTVKFQVIMSWIGKKRLFRYLSAYYLSSLLSFLSAFEQSLQLQQYQRYILVACVILVTRFHRCILKLANTSNFY